MQRTALFHGTKPVATAMLAPCSPHSVLQHRHLPSQRLAGPFHLHAQSCPSGSWPGIGGQRLPAAHSTTDDACLGALLELSVSDHPLYGQALALARQNRWGAARRVFEQFLRECPHCCKAWVSYAQMEKRRARMGIRVHPAWWERARRVLQRGLTLNPSSSCLVQAWGLLELQRGNFPAACMMLERCVALDPANSPVLRWQPVISARQQAQSRMRRSVITAAVGHAGQQAAQPGQP